MSEDELRQFEAAAGAVPGLIEISGDNLRSLCAALREAWLDLGRFAQDSEAHQLGVRAGLGLAAEMVRQRQKEWEGRGSAHMQAKGRALAHFAEELERKTKQPAPLPHDLLRLRHDRLEAALRQALALFDGDDLPSAADIDRIVREALGGAR